MPQFCGFTKSIEWKWPSMTDNWPYFFPTISTYISLVGHERSDGQIRSVHYTNSTPLVFIDQLIICKKKVYRNYHRQNKTINYSRIWYRRFEEITLIIPPVLSVSDISDLSIYWKLYSVFVWGIKIGTVSENMSKYLSLVFIFTYLYIYFLILCFDGNK